MHLKLFQQRFKVKACPQPDTNGGKAAVMDESIWASVPNSVQTSLADVSSHTCLCRHA